VIYIFTVHIIAALMRLLRKTTEWNI